MKPYLFMALLLGGIIAVLYPFKIVKTFGHLGWAEQRLGPGSSYMAWRMIGILMILASFVVIKYL